LHATKRHLRVNKNAQVVLIKPNSSLFLLHCSLLSALVKISAIWLLVAQKFIEINSFSTLSLKKWCRISICFVLLCWHGFWEILNSTCIITKDRNASRVNTKVFELLPYPQQLRTARSSCNIFNFCCGHGNRVLFLDCPRYQTGSKKMSHTWGAFLLGKI